VSEKLIFKEKTCPKCGKKFSGYIGYTDDQECGKCEDRFLGFVGGINE